MTVAEFIEELKKLPQDGLIVVERGEDALNNWDYYEPMVLGEIGYRTKGGQVRCVLQATRNNIEEQVEVWRIW
jgi:hypothetical protein